MSTDSVTVIPVTGLPEISAGADVLDQDRNVLNAQVAPVPPQVWLQHSIRH